MSAEMPVSRARILISMRGDAAVLTSQRRTFMREEAKELDAAIDRLMEEKCKHFVLDFSGCTYISSEGLGSTAQLWEWCHDHGRGHMALVLPKNDDSEVHKLFEIVGLLGTIGCAAQPSVDDALTYLQAFS